MTWRRIALVGVTLAMMLGGGYRVTAASNSRAMTGVTFAYDWPTPDFELLPIAVAVNKGFYKAAGVNLNVVFPPDVATTMKMVGIGQANIGFDTTTDIAFAKQQGVPAISIANFSQSNNWGLIGRPGEKINLHQLKGKKIGIYTDSWTKAMLPFVLRSAGLKESDVRLITSSNDEIPLLLSKKLDIATDTSNYGAIEVLTTTGKPPTMLWAAHAGAPNIPIWGYATNITWARSHAAAIRGFLAATKRAMIWASANPSAAVSIFIKMFPKNGSSRAYNMDGWKATIPLLKGPHGYFTESNAQWSLLTHALRSVGVLSKVLPPSQYYTNKYVM
jgi:ABC-type nitrate/sulfonate/bicarbonate transport system substrate-binding protein